MWQLSGLILYHIYWVSQVAVKVLPYSIWTCFPYQSRMIITVKEVVRVTVIISDKVIVCVKVIL